MICGYSYNLLIYSSIIFIQYYSLEKSFDPHRNGPTWHDTGVLIFHLMGLAIWSVANVPKLNLSTGKYAIT